MKAIKQLLFTTSLCCMSLLIKGQTPLYLNFISHNEVTDPYDYENAGDSSDYWLVTNLAKEIAGTIISRQARWNIQVDANYIFGDLIHDNAHSYPDDFLEWANNSPFIDVDGHNHFDPIANPYNYADLAYLLGSCGVTLTEKIFGGNWQTPNETWTEYQNPVHGFTYTDFEWQADILWGTASPGHVNDMDVYGIWKPSAPNSALTFLQHNPANHLTCIGGGCKDEVSFIIVPQTGLLKHTSDEIIQNIKSIADNINSIPPSSNDFYTLNIMMNFRDFPVIPSFADSVAKIIDGLEPYVNSGKIVWATLAEKYNLWYSTHSDPNDYFIYQCDSNTSGVPEFVNDDASLTVFPNPASNMVNISASSRIEIVSLFDFTGKLLNEYQAGEQMSFEVPIDGVTDGIYLLKIYTEKGITAKKLIIEK